MGGALSRRYIMTRDAPKYPLSPTPWTDQPASLSKTNAWPRNSRRRRARATALAHANRRACRPSATNSTRDVHDGAQQHVLALGFDLRTALAQTSEDDRTRPVLERCLAETTRALDDLRANCRTVCTLHRCRQVVLCPPSAR